MNADVVAEALISDGEGTGPATQQPLALHILRENHKLSQGTQCVCLDICFQSKDTSLTVLKRV